MSQENEGIRNQIRPYLREAGISSDELTSQMRIIMAAEKNRTSKMATAQAEVLSKKQVNAMEAKDSQMWTAINNLTSKVDSLGKKITAANNVKKGGEGVKSDMDNSCSQINFIGGRKRSDNQGNADKVDTYEKYQNKDSRFQDGGGKRSPVCKICAEKGVDRCTHCKKCGGVNHYAKYCLEQSKDQGLLKNGGR